MTPEEIEEPEEDIETPEETDGKKNARKKDRAEDDAEDESDEEEEDDAEEDEEEDEDGDEESDEEDEDDDDEDDDDDGDEEDDDQKGMGKRAQKRIGKLTGEVKDLKRELEEARKLNGDDGKAILAAAETAGILPQLMSADEAKGIKELDSKTGAAKYLKKLLRSDDDEFEIGGETRTRRWVQGELDDLNDEIGELRERYGAKRRELAEKSKEIFELGMAAKKAGWKPGQKVRKARKDPGIGKRSKTVTRAARKDRTLTRKNGGKKSIDWSGVTDDASAEAMILAEMED